MSVTRHSSPRQWKYHLLCTAVINLAINIVTVRSYNSHRPRRVKIYTVRVREGTEIYMYAQQICFNDVIPSATNTVKTGDHDKTAGRPSRRTVTITTACDVWQEMEDRSAALHSNTTSPWARHDTARCAAVTVGGSTTCVTASGQICRLRVKTPTSPLIHFRPTTDRISGYWLWKGSFRIYVQRYHVYARIPQGNCIVWLAFFMCFFFLQMCRFRSRLCFLQSSCNAAIFSINSSSFQLLVVMIVREKNLAQKTPVYPTSLVSHMGKSWWQWYWKE